MIYRVRVHYTSHEDMEIEAKDREEAEDKAQDNSGFNTTIIMENLEITDIEAVQDDNQYTDLQELMDREDEDER